MRLWVDGDFSLWSKGFDYDDCLALIMAVNNADVRGVSCVGGNVPVKESVSNALRVAQLTKQLPVYEGVNPPKNRYVELLRELRKLIDDRNFKLPEPVSKGDALKAMRVNASKVDKAVFLGPLTNLRLSKAKFKELIVMAGAINMPGNVTPFAEFNAYLDPEALEQAVSNSLTLVPLDVTIKATINWSILNNFKGELALLNKLPLLTLHDPLVMTYALKPDLFKTKKVGLKVFTKGLRKGKISLTQGSNVNLVTGFDEKGFVNYFKESLSNFM